MSRVSYLTADDFAKLNNACLPLAEAFGGSVYLVGSALSDPGFRDVDVRLILDDEQFDQTFRRIDGRPPSLAWGVICQGIAAHLRQVTGLPIDFQIQRMTEANEKYGDGKRNPMGRRARPYAGGGDATPWNRPREASSAGGDG